MTDGDGNVLGELEGRLVLLDQGQQVRLVLEQIDLVEDEHDGRLVAAGDIDGASIVLRELARGVGDEEQQVALFEGSADGVHQAFVELRVGLVDARACRRRRSALRGA